MSKSVYIAGAMLLLVMTAETQAQGRRSRRVSNTETQQNTVVQQQEQPIKQVAVSEAETKPSANSCAEALDEVLDEDDGVGAA